MPVIRVTTTPLSTEKKREMVSQMTQATMDVLGTPEHAHIVIIDELPIDALGMGKQTVADMIEQQKNQA